MDMHFEGGNCVGCIIRPPSCSLTEDDVREAWEARGDEFLDAWIAKKPGTRPWAFWKFDMPGVWERPPSWTHRDEQHESEVDCLDKMNLLTDAERELL
jgi:hypothetical protein